MPALSFLDARTAVLREVNAHRILPAAKTVWIEDADGRVLAEDVEADRDYPPFNRSVRDGFAVRSTDMPGRVRVVGEVRAGERYEGIVKSGEAVEIMTGAPVPDGADAVVMVEHCTRREDGTVETEHSAAAGSNIAPTACEARAGSAILGRGSRVDYSSQSAGSLRPVIAAYQFMRAPVWRSSRLVTKSLRLPTRRPRIRSGIRTAILWRPKSRGRAAIRSSCRWPETTKNLRRA